MFSKSVFVLQLLVIAAVVFSGCTVIREYPPQEKVREVKHAEYELARRLVAAFVANDARTFIGLMPEDTREKFTAADFAKTRSAIVKSAGEPISFTYLTALELETLTPQIWKIRFRRTNLKNTREFTSEVLFRVVTGMTDDKNAAIIGFQFI